MEDEKTGGHPHREPEDIDDRKKFGADQVPDRDFQIMGKKHLPLNISSTR
jgi:hypothetical protein